MSQEGRVGYSQTLVHTEATHSLPISGSIPPPPPPPPPPLPDAIISRAPVMYQPSPADSEHAVSGDDSYSPPGSPEPTAEPSSRPGQAGFAKRLMEKQGWKAGQGLGRDGKGITKAIQMVSSGKKGHAGRGKIVDKNKRKNVDSGNGGKSEVVVMTGIIDGKRNDFDHAELLQKIGDQYKRYGRVVQIVIRWNDDDEEEEGEEGSSKGSKARVYMLFADQGSALMVKPLFQS
jgi:splicing factor 45